MIRRTRRQLAAATLVGGLAFAGVACEADDGTSPGIEDPGVTDPGAPADDPLGDTDETTP